MCLCGVGSLSCYSTVPVTWSRCVACRTLSSSETKTKPITITKTPICAGVDVPDLQKERPGEGHSYRRLVGARKYLSNLNPWEQLCQPIFCFARLCSP